MVREGLLGDSALQTGAADIATVKMNSAESASAEFAAILTGPNSESFGSKLSTTKLKSPSFIGRAFFCPERQCWRRFGRRCVVGGPKISPFSCRPVHGILSFLHLTCGWPTFDPSISCGFTADGWAATALTRNIANLFYASNSSNSACWSSQSGGSKLFFSQLMLNVFGWRPSRMPRTRTGDSHASRSNSLTVL